MSDTINAVALACCRYEVNRQGLKPSDTALTALIETDPELVEKLNEYYTGEDEQGLDTFERDWLFEMVAQHLTGQSWPSISDPEADAFYKTLTDNAAKQGWEIEKK